MLKKNQTIIFWGTYDKGKPRVRLLINGLKSQGIKVIECHSDVWKGIEDKSQLDGFLKKIFKFFTIILAYPKLVIKYFTLPSHQTVVISYMGQIDILIFWLMNRIYKKYVAWDLFISLYDTVVIDRQLAKKNSIVAKLLYSLEWLGVRAANTVFMDTKTHAGYIADLYKIKKEKIKHVLVGAELEHFKPPKKITKNKDFTVLFYGQFIPLHGLDTIVYAAKILEDAQETVSWILIGRGQEQPRIDAIIKKERIKSIKRIDWIPYEKLAVHIYQADVCLGIFNSKGKATRVIPNKVFQILTTGKPLITGDTPAIRELLKTEEKIHLIQPDNSKFLAKKILDMKYNLKNRSFKENIHFKYSIGSKEVGKQFIDRILLKKNAQ